MATLSKLVVSLQANSANLISGINKSQSAIGKFVKDARKKASTMKKAFQPVVAVIKTITKAALAGVGAVTGFVTALALKANGIKNLQVTAQALGIGTTALQEWRYAAQQVGVESDKMGDIFKDVSDKLGDFLVTGGGGAADLFKKLKIDARDFIGLSPDQALLKIGEAIEPLTRQEKIFFMEAIASDAALLLPLLENNAAGFRKFAEEAKKAGLILGESEIKNAVEFSNAMKVLTDTFAGFWTQLTASLSGPLAVLAEKTKEWIDSFGSIDGAAKRAAHYILTFIEAGIKGGAKLVKSLSQIDVTFAKLELRLEKWLLLKDKISRFDPTAIAARAITGDDLDQKIAEREKAIAALEKRVKHNADNPQTDTFEQDATSLIDQMRQAIDKPFDLNVDATKSQTGATKANTTALQKQMEALKRYEANKAEKDNPKNDIGKLGNGSTGKVNTDYIFRRAMDESLKSSQIFENAARRFADSIKSGSVTPDYATLSIQNLRNIVATLQLDNVRYGGENFDTEGMRTVIDQLTELARDRISGSNKPPTLADYQAMFQRAAEDNKTAQEQAANTVAEAIRKASEDEVKATQEIVNRAPSTERSLGSININMLGADGKTLTGMIWGEPEFLRRLQAFNNQNTRNQTRAAVR